VPGLLRAWGGAAVVFVIGLIVVVGLTPRTVPGQSISVSEQAFRVHLPWLVTMMVMVPVAAVLDRRESPLRRRLQATLPLPVLGIVVFAVLGAAGATSGPATLLYAVEGVLGVAVGLFVLSLFDRPRETPAYS
jgi:energy-converting hydrogenase Eha subunit A